ERPARDGQRNQEQKEAHERQSYSNFGIEGKETGPSEQVMPVVDHIGSSDEGQRPGSGVRRIDADVQEALTEPDQPELRADGIAPANLEEDNRRGYQQLKQTAASHSNELAEHCEHEVASLMYGEVDCVH